jgi:heterodisulfide reductase subunit A2
MAQERIGVFICNCGTNIAKVVDANAVAEAVQDIPGVVSARSYKYMCSNPGQEMIAHDIGELSLTKVVVAACSPRMHENTFRKALERGGINPYFFEMANIREQCSWIHDDARAATEKAASLTRAAVYRVKFHEPLEKRSVPMCPATLVVGGGVAGLTAALELAGAAQEVHLVERTAALGGNLARVDLTPPFLDSAQDLVRELVARVERHPNVRILRESELVELKGFVGNYRPRVRTATGEVLELEVGSVMICTGAKEFDASRDRRSGHGSLPDVVTSFELEAMLRRGKIETRSGKVPRQVSIIHCVGSRSEEFHRYCSRVCCMSALKYGHQIRSAIPDARVTDIYTDMNAFGKGCEELYRKSAEAKTLFLMFDKRHPPSVERAPPDEEFPLLVRFREQLSGEDIEVPSDLVVLMVASEPREDSERLARIANISRDRDGWFIESHPKLDPVATTTDGVFIAGACQAPKDLPEAVAQARAAVARILAKISQGAIAVDGVYSEVDEKLCAGCRKCNPVCPYTAIVFDEVKKRSKIIGAACKACGCCAVACPCGAIQTRHFNDQQLHAQIEAVL